MWNIKTDYLPKGYSLKEDVEFAYLFKDGEEKPLEVFTHAITQEQISELAKKDLASRTKKQS